MPALFAYLLAVSLLVGGGYMSLHWLTAPADIRTNQQPHQSKSPPAGKDVGEKYGPPVPAAPRAENRSDDHSEMEITASSPASNASNKDTIEVPPSGTGVAEQNTDVLSKQAEDVPSGGCMPIGLTAKGELVFPMQCQELLERHRGPVASQDPVPTNSTPSPMPKERQAAEPARPAHDEKQSHSENSNAKVEDVSPSGETMPGNQKSEPEAKEKTVEKRNMQSSDSGNGDLWFNPLTFR
jgi:hypothetical protein